MAVSISVTKLARDKKRWYFTFYYGGKKIKREIWNGEPMYSKAEALKCAYELIEQLEQAKRIDNGDMSLYELYDDFVSKTKNNLKITTKNNYEIFKRNYLPLIENKHIHKLTASDINNWKIKVNKLDIQTDTKNRILRIMKAVLDFGNKMYNVLGKIQLPLYEQFKDTTFTEYSDKSKFLPEQDFKYMLTFLNLELESDYYYYVIFNMLYYCGMRIGELAALTINDFKKSTIIINKNYVRVDGKDYIQPPKSEASVRKIVLDSTTNDLLIEYIKRFKPRTIIFRRNKKYLSQQRVRDKLSQIAGASELNEKYIITPHTLRHSHSSNLRQLGFDEVAISQRLGNTPEVALKIYTHTSEDEQQKIAEKLRKN